MKLLFALATFLLLQIPSVLFAQTTDTYPNRPVHIIVPFSAGSAIDVVARLFADKLKDQLGQPVVVENRPGAASSVGTNYVATSEPDGYTLLMNSTTLVMSKIENPSLDYDIEKDLLPISLLTRSANVVVTTPSLGVKTIDELIALSKERPGQLMYGSSGIGTIGHLSIELLKSMSGLDVRVIPYSDTGQALTDVIGGQINVGFPNPLSAEPHIRAGKLQPLGIASSERSPRFPDIPTIGESVPGYEATIWQGLLAPTGTPAAVINKLHSGIEQSAADPEFREKFENLGFILEATTPEKFGDELRATRAKWEPLFKSLDIRAK